MIRLLTCTAIALALSFSQAVAQQRPSCNGTMEIVRISEVKPGMMAKFEEAVAAQKAWYKQAGTADEITLMRVLDTKTGAWSETEALTQHTTPGAPPAHDAGFDAFVALFTASSTVKTQYITCAK